MRCILLGRQARVRLELLRLNEQIVRNGRQQRNVIREVPNASCYSLVRVTHATLLNKADAAKDRDSYGRMMTR